MTLDTRFLISDPVDADEVFTYARSLLGADDGHLWELDDSCRIWPDTVRCNKAGQGLDALLYVHGTGQAPLQATLYDDNDDEYTGPHQPDATLVISFDTPYGYRGPGGLSCGELHAGYVAQLGRWCEQRSYRYAWHNEYTGDWHTDWRSAARELGRAGNRSRSWFENVVKPTIEAAHGPLQQ